MKNPLILSFLFIFHLGFSQEDRNLSQLKIIASSHLTETYAGANFAPQLGLWVDGQKCDNREFSHQYLLSIADSITYIFFDENKKVNEAIHYPILNSQAFSHWEKKDFSYRFLFDKSINKLVHLLGPDFGIEKYFQYDDDLNLVYYYEKFGDKSKGQGHTIGTNGNTEVQYFDKSKQKSSIKKFDSNGHLIKWISFQKGKNQKRNYAKMEYKWKNNQLIYFKHKAVKKGKVTADREIIYQIGENDIISEVTQKNNVLDSEKKSKILWSSKVNEAGLWEIEINLFGKPYYTFMFDEKGNWVEKEFHPKQIKEIRNIYYKSM